MSDYKELISNLRCCFSGECERCALIEDNQRCQERLLEKAADAIEYLCTDVARLEAENRAKEQYIAETIGKITRERDADEKQIPKRPTQNVFNAWCPNCKEALGKKFAEIALTTRFNKYCPNCGQALDWSEEA